MLIHLHALVLAEQPPPEVAVVSSPSNAVREPEIQEPVPVIKELEPAPRVGSVPDISLLRKDVPRRLSSMFDAHSFIILLIYYHILFSKPSAET
jgi:hypothetical protein